MSPGDATAEVVADQLPARLYITDPAHLPDSHRRHQD